MKSYKTNDLLNRVVNGSRYESDTEIHYTSNKPILIDRSTGLLLLEFDSSNKLIQLDVNMKPVYRLLFEEDLEYPSIFCINKDAYLKEIQTSALYDSMLYGCLVNGIPKKEYIYFDNKPSSLDGEKIGELINYYEESDISQKKEIQIVLEMNGVYKIPITPDINPKYQGIVESNSIGRNEQTTLISDGWASSEKVIKKQIVSK